MRNETQSSQTITQRLSLGKEEIMATAKRATKKATPARRKRAAAKSSAHPVRNRRVSSVVSASDLFEYDTQIRAKRLVERVGNNSLARIIQVSQSQPSRWTEGTEEASIVNQQKMIDLDYIFDQLSLNLYPDQIDDWFESSNPHLGGASPMSVFQVKGLAALLPAIYAVSTGAMS
jgi:hypothetical protein